MRIERVHSHFDESRMKHGLVTDIVETAEPIIGACLAPEKERLLY